MAARFGGCLAYDSFYSMLSVLTVNRQQVNYAMVRLDQALQ